MGFNELRISENCIKVGITDLIQSFYNSKEFFSNNIEDNEKNDYLVSDLDSVESHNQFFNKFPLKNVKYEISIQHVFNYKKISINLIGRIDAYSETDGIVYELKISEKDVEELIYNQSINLFKMQLFLYGYMLFKKKKKIEKLKLIIASKNQKITKEFEYNFSSKEIFLEIKKLFPFLYDIYQFEISKTKYKNIEPVFPYEKIKPIQKTIIENISKSNKFITFIEAPFASGKTSAVLYSLARKYNYEKIHYFTSRNIQKKQVYTEGEKIGYKSIIRKSFSDTCLFSYQFCRRYNCKDYFYPTEKYSILKENGCPVIYEKLFYTMYDLIISDYNYLFYKALYKDKNTICIIDEYHSFLNRVSDFFSVSITKMEIDNIKKLVMTKYKRLEKVFFDLFETKEFTFENNINIFNNTKIEENILFTGNNLIDEITNPLDSSFLNMIITVISKIFNYIKESNETKLKEFESEIYPFFQKLKTILELSQFNLVISYSKSQNEKIFTYKNLSSILQNLFSGYKAIFGISATLEPKELLYHVHDRDNFVIYSENMPKKIRAYIINNIETTYRKREKNSFQIANYIKKIIAIENNKNKILNKAILIFFPSYEFIKITEIFLNDSIYDKILVSKETRFNSSNLRVYTNSMEEINSFLVKGKVHLLFLPYRSTIQEGANLNFDIAGGIFVGLPFRVPDSQYNTHSILIDDYYENSFEILSLFPALNDVLQSSGRIGRKEEKDNFIYFIGKEYINNKVFESISDCYSDVKIINN